MKNIFKKKEKTEIKDFDINDVTMNINDISSFEYVAKEEPVEQKKPRKRKSRAKKQKEEKKEEKKEEVKEEVKEEENKKSSNKLLDIFKVEPPKSINRSLRSLPSKKRNIDNTQNKEKITTKSNDNSKNINANDKIKFSLNLNKQKDIFEIFLDNKGDDTFKISIKVHKKRKNVDISEFANNKWNRVTRLEYKPQNINNTFEVSLCPLQHKIPMVITNLAKVEINRINNKVAINNISYNNIIDLTFQ